MRKTPKDSQEHEWRQAIGLLDEKDFELFLSTPAAMEILAMIPRDMRESARKQIESLFRVVPFDYFCAMEGAGLHHLATKSGERQTVKVDAMIVASAKRWKMDALCTTDERQSELARAAGIQNGPPSLFRPQMSLL